MHGDRRRRRGLGLVVLALMLLVGGTVGFIAYNAGVSHGLAMGATSVALEKGGQGAQAAVPPPAAYPYGYYGYGWHPWHPWGFGFFLGPLFFIFFWVFLLRLLFWRRWHGGWGGGGWGGGCYGRGYYRGRPWPDDPRRRDDLYL